MEKTLIFVRHAHRDKRNEGDNDNGLTVKGQRQAKEIARLYDLRFQDTQAYLVSSPKLRCRETLEPLARKLALPVEISDLLDEQTESDELFFRRIRKFHRWWKLKGPALTVACSHGDWIPLSVEELVGTPVEIKKGGWIELVSTGSETRLRWAVQLPGELIS